MKERVREVQLQRAERLLLAKVPRGRQHFHVKLGFLEQQLDHFNRQGSKTFRQVGKPNDAENADDVSCLNKHVDGIEEILALFSTTQTYLVNDKYWKKPDGPVFLFIGGEGPLSWADVVFGTVGRRTWRIRGKTV